MYQFGVTTPLFYDDQFTIFPYLLGILMSLISLASPRSRLYASAGGGGGSFTPLQHFSADAMTLGVAPAGDLNGDYSSGFGAVVQNSVHRPSKSTAIALSIRATSFGDKENFPADGDFALFLNPPSSRGSSKFGGQNQWFHVGMWMYVPGTFNTDTTTLTDGALKFILHCFPSIGGPKDDVHTCTPGFAFINEFDPNSATNNSYPSTRAGTEYSFPRDQWFWFERGTFLQSDGDSSICRVWVNNVLLLERNARVVKWLTTDSVYHTATGSTVGNPSLPTSAAVLEQVLIFSYWNAGSPQTQTLYIDDVATAISETGMTTDSLGNSMMGMGAF